MLKPACFHHPTTMEPDPAMPQSLANVLLHTVFSVSESQQPVVRAYIERQEEHHRTMTFQDEYRGLLERHGIAFDERYVWD